MYRHVYQEIEDFPMFNTVTKFNARVDPVERLPDLLRQAFRVATTGALGPIHRGGRRRPGAHRGKGLHSTLP